MIDSVLEKPSVTPVDVQTINYYATILKNNTADSVKLSELNLEELTFYSQTDEKILFPPVSLDSIASSFNLVLQSDLLGYYYSPFKGVITSNFGFRDGRLHKGIDIDLEKGDKYQLHLTARCVLPKSREGLVTWLY